MNPKFLLSHNFFDKIDQSYLDCKIPFLSPPNHEWPVWLQIMGTFGNLVRTTNQDNMDIAADVITTNVDIVLKGKHAHGVTIEVKDHSMPIDLPELTKICNNIKNFSLIHLVFVRSLQEEYFTKKSFRESIKNCPGCKRKFYRLDISPLAVLNDMSFGEDIHYDGIVIFVVVPRG